MRRDGTLCREATLRGEARLRRVGSRNLRWNITALCTLRDGTLRWNVVVVVVLGRERALWGDVVSLLETLSGV